MDTHERELIELMMMIDVPIVIRAERLLARLEAG